MAEKEKVLEVLKDVKDPELGLSIVDMGLVYDIKIRKKSIKVVITLTSPMCPLGGIIIDEIEKRLSENFTNMEKFEVDITFDPPWDYKKMSSDLQEKFGFLDHSTKN